MNQDGLLKNLLLEDLCLKIHEVYELFNEKAFKVPSPFPSSYIFSKGFLAHTSLYLISSIERMLCRYFL